MSFFLHYSFPSGHVESDEYPAQAGLRELEEEIGIKAKSLIKIATEDTMGDSCRKGSDAHRWHAFLYLFDNSCDIRIKEEGVDYLWLRS
ncbi:MAG: NUDIX domain-containing protein [Patescibacteria group bacterium]|nr:NUDIX domain-containing protein [Patescibacteria group bacterium]